MIISASRRTDIPAFFGEWFYNRLLAKEVIVRNPMNPKIVTKIPLDPKTTECIVFWTKNPRDFIKYLPKIDELGYKYYFQFTINSYDSFFEKNVGKKDAIINTFIELSKLIGKEKVIWRYDPIIINDKYTMEYHTKWFEYIIGKLQNYTEKCVISFVDSYSFLKNSFKENNISELDINLISNIALSLSKIALAKNIPLYTCTEKIDLDAMGIKHNKCIDDELINRITNSILVSKKDASQREECGCIASRDIGTYNTCNHNCVYCYAKRNTGIQDNIYDPNSPILCDKLIGDEKITILKNGKNLNQLDLFK